MMEIQKLCEDIEKVFPKFFDNFENWEYGNGTNAGKDFKRIFNRSRRIKRALTKDQMIEKDLYEALDAFIENIDSWLETGEPASPEISKAIYDKAKKALSKADGLQWP